MAFPFTSGSTGIPKIVPLTHFNLVECANSLEDMGQWMRAGDVLYGFLPIYHVFGFAVEILASVHYGAGVLLQPTVNPKDIMDDFVKFRPQVIPAVPRVWEVFRNKIIDNIKAKKKWWLVYIVLKYGKFLNKIGLNSLVKKVQKPIKKQYGQQKHFLCGKNFPLLTTISILYNTVPQSIMLLEQKEIFCLMTTRKSARHGKKLAAFGTM